MIETDFQYIIIILKDSNKPFQLEKENIILYVEINMQIK